MDWTKRFCSSALQDRNEFDEHVSRCHRQAYKGAYGLMGNNADAEDLTQEAFLRAYRFFDRYNRQMPFENWLYRIISNVFIDELRKRPKVKSQSLDQPLAGLSVDSDIKLEIPDSKCDPENMMLQVELDEPLQRALNGLPPDFRKTVILADVEGLSYEDISETMGCSLGTVRSRLHRGRKMMRNRLQSCPGWDARRGQSELS